MAQDSTIWVPDDGREAALASLAYINVTWESSRTSYLDNFVPFVVEVLRSKGAAMTPADIRAEVRTRFGLDFPTAVVTSLVGRTVRTRAVRRIPRSEAVEVTPEAADRLPDVAAQQQDCKRQQGALIKSLVQFAYDRFATEWNEEAAEVALLDYIQSHALPMLTSSVRGSAFSSNLTPDQGPGYVVSTFVAEIFEKDPVSFTYLDQLVKGSMLAAVLFVDPTGQVSRRFRRTTLYLDTPICLRALGHEGEEAREAAWSFLHLARSQGATLACFQHSVREMRGIIQGAKSALGRTVGAETAIRGVARHFRSTGATVSDVDLALASLDKDLERDRIQVVSSPEHTSALGLDEAALEDLLQSEIGYRDEATRLADLNSLTAIHRLRGGQSDAHLETCRAVLVTSNWSLTRASRRFFNSGRHEWPLVMMDSSVATLLWVKAPMAQPDLPKKQIIADCYAAMSPSQSMWTKFVGETRRLEERGDIDADSVALLRYSHEAERALMDLTFGDQRRVNEQVVRGALERARQAAADPAQRERDAARRIAQEASSAADEARFESERHLAEQQALQTRVEALEEQQRRRARQVVDSFSRRVRIVAGIAKGVGATVVVASVLLGVGTFFPALTRWIPHGLELWLRVFAGVAIVASGVTLWRGSSVTGWIEQRRDQAIEKRLQRENLIDPRRQE